MIELTLSARKLIFGIKLLFSEALLNRYPAVEEYDSVKF
jgi:hypothetical protein